MIKKSSELQQAATFSYSSNRKFFQELGNWLRISKTDRDDGMPGFVIGLSNMQSKIICFLIQNWKPLARLLAKKDRQLIIKSSAVGFIVTKRNDPKDWFNAGRCYEAIALQATVLGLAISPMAAMIENSEYNNQANILFSLQGKPQAFFRIGYSNHPGYHTPRRNWLLPPMKTQDQLMKIIDVKLETRQIQIREFNINYVVAGKGEPLLLLHGANIGWAQWYQNIAELAKHFTVYALDLPGAGNSSKVNFHKAKFERDYLEIVDKFVTINKLTNISIVGSSFGGWIALQLAIRNKPYIKKIVLANPLGFTTHMPIQFRPVSIHPLAVFLTKTALRPNRNNKNLEKFMRDVFFDKKLHLAKQFIDYFYELSTKSHNLLFISRLAHPTGMRPELFLKGKLHKITTPVLVIWGKEDPLMPFSSVEQNIYEIESVKLERLEKVGHMPPVEVPSLFNKLATDFLKTKA